MTHIFCFLRKIVARWLFNDLLYKHRYITFPRFYFHRFYIRETITQRELFFTRQLIVRGSTSAPESLCNEGEREEKRGKRMKGERREKRKIDRKEAGRKGNTG